MNYVIAIPKPIEDRITSWELSIDAEDTLYAEFEGGFTQQELDKLWRHPGPGSTYIWSFDFPDPLIFGITHSFTFWLGFGPETNYLYIYQGEYDRIEGWHLKDRDEEYDPDYGDD